jgi:anthranilate phosphoribosyltransferase
MPDTTTKPFDIALLLNDVFEGRTLSRDRARHVMGKLMDGELSQMQAAALLAAVRTRGETVDEITGFAEAMRERAVHVPAQVDGPLLDTCGTGGTGVSTFNISTAGTFVIAAAGGKVAKHGNRAWTRRSGAADVLEALGVSLDQTPEHLARSIEEVGVAFLFARNHHPAMKFVSPIRSDLRARTVFNSLGPLTNPAGATRQLMGVYDPNLLETFAQVLAGLGIERALVVHGDGLDEMTVCGVTHVTELNAQGELRSYTLHPQDVGLKEYPLEELLGGTPEENATLIRGVLSGEIHGAKRDVVLLNAGAALYLADQAPTIRDGIQLAADAIDSGRAIQTLERFITFSRA